MFRTLTSRQLVFDVALATACFTLRLATGINELPMFFVVVAMAVALGMRRASPALALAIAGLGAILLIATGLSPDVSNLAILPVLYATAAYGTPLVKWLGLASSGVGALVVALYASLPDLLLSSRCHLQSGSSCGSRAASLDWLMVLVVLFLLSLAVFGLSWTLGLLAKTWRRARDSAQARVVAERQRIDAQQDVVVEQERNRIARDMHDVVAHSLAVVIAQADGARYARAQDPDAVDAALATIASTAREALGEVRILLGQLRHSQDAVPQPELADLERLFEQLRSSGLRIVVTQEGTEIPLVLGQQLAIYRIAQEALTNALRHGDSAEDVTVRFEWSAETVTLSVLNAVRPDAVGGMPAGAASTLVGHGLAGMRERAALWGGSLSAGRSGDKGYLVTATLPIRPLTESVS